MESNSKIQSIDLEIDEYKTNLPAPKTLNEIGNKFNLIHKINTDKNVKFVGKKRKTINSKSEIQKVIDTVRSKAPSNDLIAPILQSLKYDLNVPGTSVITELAKIRYKLKKIGFGKEICNTSFKIYRFINDKIDKYGFITNDLFHYVAMLYSKLTEKEREMIEAINSVYVCNSNDLFLDDKTILQEFFYEECIPEISIWGNIEENMPNPYTISIDGTSTKTEIFYKGQNYLFFADRYKGKPIGIMALKGLWKEEPMTIRVDDKDVQMKKYSLSLPNGFRLFHFSKELKNGIKKLGKKSGLFVIGANLTPTNVAAKTLLLDTNLDANYVIEAEISKAILLKSIGAKIVPSFACNMENLIGLIELSTLTGFLDGKDVGDIISEFKIYHTTFSAYRKLYFKLLSIISKLFDWFVDKVSYDKISLLKKKMDDAIIYWEEITTSNVENNLKTWVIKLLTCKDNYKLENETNMITNFFANLGELKLMLLKTRTVFSKILDFTISAETIENQLRALAVGFRRFFIDGSIPCFTITRTSYAFLGNTIGNNSIEELVDELKKMRTNAYKSSSLIVRAQLERIRNSMLRDFANLEQITENMTSEEKQRVYAKDSVIPEGINKAVTLNMSENEMTEHNNIMSDIFSIHNVWSQIAKKPRRDRVRKFKKSLGKNRDGTEKIAEISVDIKENGEIKEAEGANGIVSHYNLRSKSKKLQDEDIMMA